jgi:uncharacterized protein (TIGR02246 family)
MGHPAFPTQLTGAGDRESGTLTQWDYPISAVCASREKDHVTSLSVDDQLAIQRLYADYCFAVDDGDGPAFAACFTHDGALDVAPGDPVSGAEALAAFAPAVVLRMPRLRHLATNISVDGSGDEAASRAYLYVYQATEDGHRVLSTARYRDTLRRVDGRWHFVRREVVPDKPS